LLEILPEYVLHWIVKRGSERHLNEKETLLTEGEKNESLISVLDGLFGSYTSDSPRLLEHFGAGSVIGESAYFTDLNAPASVVAEESSLVLEIPYSLLAPKLEHDPGYAADFYRALMTVVADRLHHTSRRLYASESALLADQSRLCVTLMDIDLQSLAYVDEIRTKRNLTSNITLVNENLIALYLGRSKTKVERQDLIYSIGLIDYLNDKLVNKVLAYSYENLAPGGRVILGNFHPWNPAKEFMDYVLEWNLIHRREADMNRLFKRSVFGKPCSMIQFEALGINLFAECSRD
jgi:CRP-like cAMP-binding protein